MNLEHFAKEFTREYTIVMPSKGILTMGEVNHDPGSVILFGNIPYMVFHNEVCRRKTCRRLLRVVSEDFPVQEIFARNTSESKVVKCCTTDYIREHLPDLINLYNFVYFFDSVDSKQIRANEMHSE